MGENLTEGESAILKVIDSLANELRDSNEERRRQYEDLKGTVDLSLGAITQSVSKVTTRVDSHDVIFSKKDKEGRRRNIVISGLRENENERWVELEQKVDGFFKNTLKMDFELDRDLDQVIRMGARGKENRPILVKFKAIRKKIEAIGKRGNLKNTKIYLDDDYSKDEQEERKSKLVEVKRLRALGQTAFLSGTKVVVKDRSVTEIQNTGNVAEWQMEVDGNSKTKNGKVETPGRKRLNSSPLEHKGIKKTVKRSDSTGRGNNQQGGIQKWITQSHAGNNTEAIENQQKKK